MNDDWRDEVTVDNDVFSFHKGSHQVIARSDKVRDQLNWHLFRNDPVDGIHSPLGQYFNHPVSDDLATDSQVQMALTFADKHIASIADRQKLQRPNPATLTTAGESLSAS